MLVVVYNATRRKVGSGRRWDAHKGIATASHYKKQEKQECEPKSIRASKS